MRNSTLFFFLASTIFTVALSALPLEEIYVERVTHALHSLYYNPWAQNEAEVRDRLERIQPLIPRIYQKEAELQSGYYQVLTAQDSKFLAYQIILKELYRALFRHSFDEYEFLRPHRDPEIETDLSQFLSAHPDLAEVDQLAQESEDLDDEAEEEFWARIESDTHPAISRQLISASFTLETSTPLDSALFVFAGGANLSGEIEGRVISQYLLDAFALEGLHSREIEECIGSLVECSPTSREGILLQFFLPKEEVSKFLYVSYGGGFVKREETDKIHETFLAHERKREWEKFDPEENDQVRILAGALDPFSVKIFRYSTIDPLLIQEYEGLVRSELKSLLERSL